MRSYHYSSDPFERVLTLEMKLIVQVGSMNHANCYRKHVVELGRIGQSSRPFSLVLSQEQFIFKM